MTKLIEGYPFPGSTGDTWPYSEAMRAGDFLFVSGQGPLDMIAEEVVHSTIEEETDLTLNNIRKLLESAGSCMSQVIKTCVHLADLNEFDGMGKTFRRHFEDPRPARITVESKLWGGIGVEIDAIAYAPQSGRLAKSPKCLTEHAAAAGSCGLFCA